MDDQTNATQIETLAVSGERVPTERVIAASVIKAIREYYNKSPELGDFKKPQPLPLTWPRLYDLWRSYTNPDAKFAFAGLYVTGQRVMEFVKTRRGDMDENFSFDGHPTLTINSITEKNKQTPRRTLGIRMDRKDAELVKYFWARVQQQDDLDANIWGYTDRTIRNYLAKREIRVEGLNFETLEYVPIDLRIHPHYLRHCRATHLANDFGYSFLQLKKFFGWQTNSMPDLYVSTTWQDLVSGQYEKG